MASQQRVVKNAAGTMYAGKCLQSTLMSTGLIVVIEAGSDTVNSTCLLPKSMFHHPPLYRPFPLLQHLFLEYCLTRKHKEKAKQRSTAFSIKKDSLHSMMRDRCLMSQQSLKKCYDGEMSLPSVRSLGMPICVTHRCLTAIPHLLEVDDVYRGYRLPAGSVVVPNTWYVSLK